MTHRNIFWPAVLIAALLGLFVGAAPARAEARLALIIGNGNYSSMSALRNTRNDAKLMRGTLEKLGFEVVEAIDADRRGMSRAVQEFGSRLRRAGEDAMGLFYYAGHGVQSRGENYLIPLEAQIEVESDLEFEAITLASILRQMQEAGNATNILILDACRNNPLAGTSRSASRGLAPARAEGGAIIAFAAAPGQTAADGTGVNSPYAIALAEAMQEPGLVIEQVFRRVLVDVEEATGGQQIPWVQSSLRSDVYLLPDTTEPAIELADPPALPDPDPVENPAVPLSPQPTGLARFEPMTRNLSERAYQILYLTSLTDGGFVLSGKTLPQGNSYRTAWASRLDAAGETVWEKEFAQADGHNEALMTVPRRAGGFYVLGVDHPQSEEYGLYRSFWVRQIDAKGNELALWPMGASNNLGAVAKISSLADGGFILAAHVTSDLTDKDSKYIWVARFDEQGKTIWAQSVAADPQSVFIDMAVSSDRIYIAYRQPSDKRPALDSTALATLDHTGRLITDQRVTPPDADYGVERMALATNGDLLLVGAHSEDIDNVDFWFARLAPDGTVIASATHDLQDVESATAVAPLPDGGAMVAGETVSFVNTPNDQDIWMARLDASGRMIGQIPGGLFGADDWIGDLDFSQERGLVMLGSRYMGDNQYNHVLAAGLPLDMIGLMRADAKSNAVYTGCIRSDTDETDRKEICRRAKIYFPELFEDDVAAAD